MASTFSVGSGLMHDGGEPVVTIHMPSASGEHCLYLTVAQAAAPMRALSEAVERATRLGEQEHSRQVTERKYKLDS